MIMWKVFSKVNVRGEFSYFPMFNNPEESKGWRMVSENDYNFDKSIVATDDEFLAVSYHIKGAAEKFIEEVKDGE